MSVPVIQYDPTDCSNPILAQFQELMRSAPAITVLCGAGVSTSAGIKDFRSKDGLYHQTFPHGSCTLKGSQLFDLSTLEDHEKLHILNKVMLELRVLVRKARPTAFHRLVSALHSFGCLVQCYTQNFDGLQTRDDPEMDRVVFELHGTNTELKCRVCQRRPPQAAEHYDQRLADEIVVACPHCLKHVALKKMKNSRWEFLKIGNLAPDILFNQESTTGKDGQDFHRMLEKHGKATKLLIIAGTSLLTPGFASLARSLAGQVQKGRGLVVYINRDRLPPGKWEKYVHLHIQTDIDSWAVNTLNTYLQVRKRGKQKAFAPLVQRIIDMLHMKESLSFRSTFQGARPSLREVADEIVQSNSQPEKSNRITLSLGESTLPRGKRRKMSAPTHPPAQQVDTSEVGPHRVALIIFRHGVKERAADQIRANAAARWRHLGWEVSHQAVDLSRRDQPIEVPFGGASYHTILVHITSFVENLHTSNDSAREEDDVSEMLAIGRKRTRKLDPNSLSSQAILLCSGGLLSSKVEAKGLEVGIKGSLFRIQNVLVCLNLRAFSVEDWGKFIADATVVLALPGRQVVADLVYTWMTNTGLISSTNLVWFSVDRPSLLLLASPFHDRPCGRPLPECPCKQTTPHRRKRWIVQHNCHDGMLVEEAQVRVKCSCCNRQWRLPTNHMTGVICEVNELFAVVAPCFC